MVLGVSQGFTRTLEIQGVGYRAEMQEENLVLHVGYSHPVVIDPPEGVAFAVNKTDRTLTCRGSTKKWWVKSPRVFACSSAGALQGQGCSVISANTSAARLARLASGRVNIERGTG